MQKTVQSPSLSRVRSYATEDKPPDSSSSSKYLLQLSEHVPAFFISHKATTAPRHPSSLICGGWQIRYKGPDEILEEENNLSLPKTLDIPHQLGQPVRHHLPQLAGQGQRCLPLLPNHHVDSPAPTLSNAQSCQCLLALLHSSKSCFFSTHFFLLLRALPTLSPKSNSYTVSTSKQNKLAPSSSLVILLCTARTRDEPGEGSNILSKSPKLPVAPQVT